MAPITLPQFSSHALARAVELPPELQYPPDFTPVVLGNWVSHFLSGTILVQVSMPRFSPLRFLLPFELNELTSTLSRALAVFLLPPTASKGHHVDQGELSLSRPRLIESNRIEPSLAACLLVLTLSLSLSFLSFPVDFGSSKAPLYAIFAANILLEALTLSRELKVYGKHYAVSSRARDRSSKEGVSIDGR